MYYRIAADNPRFCRPDFATKDEEKHNGSKGFEYDTENKIKLRYSESEDLGRRY